MSSRIHGRGQKILDLCKNKEDQEITKEPEPSYISISIVQNVGFEYIRLDGSAFDSFKSDTNLFSFIDDNQNNNIHKEQEGQFEDNNLFSFLPLKSPSPNFTITSTTITAEVQSTSQNNSVAGDTDSNIPSSSIKISPQIEDLISDESIQKGLVPYDFMSESESDYESYPEKNKKRKKRVQIQKSNWFAEKIES